MLAQRSAKGFSRGSINTEPGAVATGSVLVSEAFREPSVRSLPLPVLYSAQC